MDGDTKTNDANAELLAVRDEIKAYVSELQEKSAAATAEGKAELAKALAELKGLHDKHADLVKRVDEAELKSGRSLFGGSGGEEVKSWGAQFIASDEFKSAIAAKSYSTLPVEVKAADPPVGGLTTILGRNPQLNPEINAVPDRGPSVRPLLTAVPCDTDAVAFVKETAFNAIFGETRSESASGQKDIELLPEYSGGGFLVGSTITIVSADGNTTENAVIASVTIDSEDGSSAVGGTITTVANLSNTYAAGATVTSTEYGCTPEAVLRPVAQITTEKVTVPVEDVDTFIEVTTQVLNDTPRLMDYIDRRLMQRHALNVDLQLLSGAGTAGSSLEGILSDSDIQTFSWSNGEIGDGKADAVLRGIAYCALSEYMPDAIVMHDLTWVDIATEKASEDGHYLNQGISVQGTTRTLWGLPVILSPKIAQGTVLVGAFGMGATLYEREAPTITLSDSHRDNFQRKIMAILLTERLCQTIERPEAFVKVTLDAAPS